jgi:hypothetical protein
LASRRTTRAAESSDWWHPEPVTDYATDPKGYEERLKAKLRPARVRSTLAFAGLFQLTHEILKSVILDEVKGFYGYTRVGDDNAWLPESGELEYQRSVLALAPNKPFRASLLWLQNMEAITAEQSAQLDDIYAHRHDLTHELAKYLTDLNLEPDFDLFIEALKTLRSLSRFWTEVEAGIGTFEDYPDLDLDAVTNGRILLLDLCISAYGDGLTATQ